MRDTAFCGSCRFWVGVDAESTSEIERNPVGECRRHAPRFSDHPMYDSKGYWPYVEMLSWCGEYQEDRNE